MASAVALNSDLLALGDAIWTWRAATQPFSGDDIPRIERPAGWVPDWSADAVAERRQRLTALEAEHAQLGREVRRWPVADQVDYRLLGSALARVRWELDVVRGWQRNPQFYVHQTLAPLLEALLRPPPIDSRRIEELIRRAEHIPQIVQVAKENLAADAAQPFATLALAGLENIGSRLQTLVCELTPLLEPAGATR